MGFKEEFVRVANELSQQVINDPGIDYSGQDEKTDLPTQRWKEENRKENMLASVETEGDNKNNKDSTLQGSLSNSWVKLQGLHGTRDSLYVEFLNPQPPHGHMTGEPTNQTKGLKSRRGHKIKSQTFDPLKRRKRVCGLCNMSFADVEGTVTRQAIHDCRLLFLQNRKSDSANSSTQLLETTEENTLQVFFDSFNKKYKYRLYDEVNVCLFCSQFFPLDYSRVDISSINNDSNIDNITVASDQGKSEFDTKVNKPVMQMRTRKFSRLLTQEIETKKAKDMQSIPSSISTNNNNNLIPRKPTTITRVPYVVLIPTEKVLSKIKEQTPRLCLRLGANRWSHSTTKTMRSLKLDNKRKKEKKKENELRHRGRRVSVMEAMSQNPSPNLPKMSPEDSEIRSAAFPARARSIYSRRMYSNNLAA